MRFTAFSAALLLSGVCSVLAIPKQPLVERGISKDGTCGGKAGLTCAGSVDGPCCSQYGWWYVSSQRVQLNIADP
jgi:hypothetical protein